VTGLAQIFFPPWDNTHLALLELTVDPLVRRRGLGRKLFEAAVERIRDEGRTLVIAGTYDQPAPVAFADAMGLERASDEVMRRSHITALDWTRLDRDFAEAGERARDYEVLQMRGAIPDGMLAAVGRMTEAINDAPIDDLQIEDEVFSPERLRAFEVAQAARGRRLYRVVVRHRGTGELAGHTLVGIDSERPWHGWQYDTSVLRAHRGHRLGLLLKIGMVRWLAEEEPQLRTLDTWNAASNTHMIKVNEVLGYEVLARAISWQRRI
jgi:GNAT superfamily N-acetyltransferase